nr:transposase, MuDR, MULE transposase domain protein [Tanacetum cinerariifolium]
MDASFNNENEAWEYSLDINDFDLHLTPAICSSNSTHVKPSPYTTNPVTIILGPSGVVHISSSTRVEPSTSDLNPVRKYPVLQDVGDDDDFKRAAWVNATNYVNTFGGTIIGCLGDVGVGEFSPSYYISQLGESLIISGSFGFGNFRIIYARDLDFEDGIISSRNLLFTIPHPSVHFLKLLGFNNANEPIVEAEIVQQWYSSLQVFHPIIEGFVNVQPKENDYGCKKILWKEERVRLLISLIQQARLLKEKVFILYPDGALMSTQQYMDKVVEDVGDDDDFKSAAWVSATNYVNTFGGTVTGCLGDVNNFLKNKKLEQVVGIVKSCSPNMLGDLNVTMKDLSSTIPGTIHHKVIGEGGYEKDIIVGAVMILTNVFVFSPNPSKHYLNITMRNVVELFHKDIVLGNGSS